MYSRLQLPPGVRNVRIKPEYRKGGYYGDSGLAGENYLAKSFDGGLTWVVFNFVTGEVDAIFYGKPNGNGWSPSQAHARSYLYGLSAFNPWELDQVP